MDQLNALLLSLFAGQPLLLLLAGVFLPMILSKLGIKLPAPKPVDPNAPQPPAPPSTGRPLLDAILKLLGGQLAGAAHPAAAVVPTADLLAAQREINRQLAARAAEADAIRAALTPEPSLMQSAAPRV